MSSIVATVAPAFVRIRGQGHRGDMADGGGSSVRGRVRMALAVVGGLVVLIILAIVIGFLPRGTRQITSVADQVAVPAGWALTQELVEPERFICLGDNPCPSAFRTWATGGNLSYREFAAFTAATGWHLEVDPTCELDPNAFGRQTACQATGTVDGYVATITVRGSVDDPASATVQLLLTSPS